jgi:hypothetical protein
MITAHSDVIRAFGGAGKLAIAIGLNPRLSGHWHTRGIPAKFWPLVEDAARQRGILITARDLMRMPATAPISSMDSRRGPRGSGPLDCASAA